MKFEITYRYTEDLQRRIYVERAERRSSANITVEDNALSPAAREAALTALTLRDYGATRLLLDAPAETSSWTTAVAAGRDRVTADWLDPVSAEPDAARASSDVETLLEAAASAAPRILARRSELDAEAKRAAAEKVEATIVERLARPVGLWLEGKPGSRSVNTYALRRDIGEADPRIVARVAAEQAEAERQNQEHDAAERAAARRWAALVERFCADVAPDLLPRLRDDLLPEDELLGRIRDHVLAALDEHQRYERLRKGDVAHGMECASPDVEFTAEDADELAGGEHDKLVALRCTLPALDVAAATLEAHEAIGVLADELARWAADGTWPAALTRAHDASGDTYPTVVAREHMAICQNKHCAEPHDRCVRRSALVTVHVGGRKLSREYAL